MPTILEEFKEAVDINSFTEVEDILQHYDIDYEHKKWALEKAVAKEFSTIVEILLQYIDPTEKSLSYAVIQNNLDILRILLDKSAEHINAGNGLILIRAIQNNNPEMVSLLLQHGVNVHENEELALKIALTKADYTGDSTIVKLLLEAGANVHESYSEVLLATENLELLELLLQYSNINENNRRQFLIYPHLRDEIIARGHELFESQEETERVQRMAEAKLLEEENELKRQSYKSYEIEENEEPEDIPFCTNPQNLYGDPINKDEIIVFLIENSKKGECLTKEDIDGILSSDNNISFWNGPPAGVARSAGVGAGWKTEETEIFKLPWTGIWVEKHILTTAQTLPAPSFIVLKQGKKYSIGSKFGASHLHGQWGGSWGYNSAGEAIYVSEANFQPDDRYVIYTEIKEITN